MQYLKSLGSNIIAVRTVVFISSGANLSRRMLWMIHKKTMTTGKEDVIETIIRNERGRGRGRGRGRLRLRLGLRDNGMKDPGCYQLLMYLPKPRRIRVGRLGIFRFPAGWYIYTGSAMNGVSARVARHLRKHKRLHWHIDYLLEFARIRGIKKCLTTQRKECSLNRILMNCEGVGIPVKNFGSSDCRCESHLVYFKNKPEILFEPV